jgi:ATP-dependent helicase HepA
MSNSNQPVPGQRWASDSEPELGLGIVMRSGGGRAEIFFPAAGEHRQYALGSAPVRRVAFTVGDAVETHGGVRHVVDSVEEEGGMLVYCCAGERVPEAALSDNITFSKPEDRLLAGQVDELGRFGLRGECLRRRRLFLQSGVRGFVGGRVDLIPHQIHIAAEVAKRAKPRVLLADEVGLGKTIEAGLILQRLHATGRAGRVLVLVPPALVNQWYVEMLRRFQLGFSIYDEERCRSLEGGGANPFHDSQLVLCGIDLPLSRACRAEQVVEAGWDLLVVDEAHHLEWSPEGASPAYRLVEELASRVPSLLLLTATPRQLGEEGHFARLRLLDPDRFPDLERFLEEGKHYEEVAKVADAIVEGRSEDVEFFAGTRAEADWRLWQAGDQSARERLLATLLDEFGTGRVMFRNTRAALKGFPRREARLVPLECEDGEAHAARADWLAAFLGDGGPSKVLVISRTRELAERAMEDLMARVRVKAAMFHEGLTLLQRDRNAAYFAAEDGARVLFCSEIGSEGRNFQFAHDLVLFDLPGDPELLEQRIGRLDRIGQTSTITIHVPFVSGTPEEIAVRWYHEGMDAFENHPHGAWELYWRFRERLEAAMETMSDVPRLVRETAKARKELAGRLRRGRDRLLELNSCRAEAAGPVIEAIRRHDGDLEFEAFFIRMLDHLGVGVVEHDDRTWTLSAGAGQLAVLPGLDAEGTLFTFDRSLALAREDIGFLTADHPLVGAALEALLGVETGNSVFGVWRSPLPGAVFLEVVAVVECVAPPALHVDRFLPPTPLRVVVDQGLRDCCGDEEYAKAVIERGDVHRLLEAPGFKRKHLPSMIAKARSLAEAQRDKLVAEAARSAEAEVGRGLRRLEDLRQLHGHVREAEVTALVKLGEGLKVAIEGAGVRLDAVKLVLRTPAS